MTGWQKAEDDLVPSPLTLQGQVPDRKRDSAGLVGGHVHATLWVRTWQADSTGERLITAQALSRRKTMGQHMVPGGSDQVVTHCEKKCSRDEAAERQES